jgi:hypothetical protein
MRPAGTLQRILSNQLLKLVQPILQPLNRPMLSQAPATPPSQTPASTDNSPTYTFVAVTTAGSKAPVRPELAAVTAPVVPTAPPVPAGSSATAGAQTATTAWTPKPATIAPIASVNSSTASGAFAGTYADASGGGSSAGGSGSASAAASVATATSAGSGKSAASSSPAAAFEDVVFGSNSLTIASADHSATGGGAAGGSGGGGSADTASTSSSSPKSTASNLTVSPTATILIPSSTGTITETNTGMLRGWGTPTESGKLIMSGVAVADGDGIDRTLNLTHFNTIQTAGPASAQTSSQPAQSSAQVATIASTPAALSSPAPVTTGSTAAGSGTAAAIATASTTPKIAAATPAATAAPAQTSATVQSIAPAQAVASVPSIQSGNSTASTAAVNTTVATAAGFDQVSFVPSPASTTIATTPGGSPQSGLNQQSGISGDATSAPPLGTIAPPLNGWYAIDHGRLCMNLQASPTSPTQLSWGDDPDGSLSLINSLRLSIRSDSTGTLPSQLSLLSPDRSDAMNLSEITGATIGLWTIDPAAGAISDASLEIHYDTLLANALGANPDSISLWTLNAQTDQWSEVGQNYLVLDTTDSLILGSAQDFSAFAVSAIPAPGADVDFIRAHQLAMIYDSPMRAHHDAAIAGLAAATPGNSFASSTSSIPEPVGLPLLAITLGLLGRRRRRAL